MVARRTFLSEIIFCNFLNVKRNTRYTEAEIAEWFSGFIEARLRVQ